MENQAKILIVDDIEINRQLLVDHITAFGHKSMEADNGRSALEQMKKEAPDLVLLDILMPEMDGYEALDRLKSDENLRHIPVIVITGVDELESAAKCIAKGAADYLVKPFNSVLLQARINGCLEKKRLDDQEKIYQKQIENHNLRLEDTVRQKTMELSQAHERLKILDKAKDDFLSLISHELRTPLTGLFGAVDILFDDELTKDDIKVSKDIFLKSKDRMLRIIDEALLLKEIEITNKDFYIQPVSAKSILRDAVKMASQFAGFREVSFGEIPESDVQILCQHDLLTKALNALLTTAVKFSQKGSRIAFSSELLNSEFSFRISTTGLPIPENLLPKFFDLFSITEAITPGGDLGLAPPLAERIITLFGGSVAVENLDLPGVCFTVKLKPEGK